MTRRRLFHEADLARALRVAQRVGLTVNRFEIDATGKIVVESGSSSPAAEPEVDRVQAALDAARRRHAERRAARAASRQH